MVENGMNTRVAARYLRKVWVRQMKLETGLYSKYQGNAIEELQRYAGVVT